MKEERKNNKSVTEGMNRDSLKSYLDLNRKTYF